MAYLTAAIAKSDWLNITTSDHDALIGRLIAYVEAQIEGLCNQPIQAQSVTLYVCGNSKQTLLLPYHTVPVTLSTLKSRTLPSDTFATVTGGVVVDMMGSKKLWLQNGFTASEYEIVATVGFATVPSDIQVCGYELLKELYLESVGDESQDRFGVTSIATGASGVTITKAIKELLERVRQRLLRYTYYTI